MRSHNKTIILIQRREIFVGIEMIFFVPKNNLARSKDSQLQGGSKSSEVKIVRLTCIIYIQKKSFGIFYDRLFFNFSPLWVTLKKHCPWQHPNSKTFLHDYQIKFRYILWEGHKIWKKLMPCFEITYLLSNIKTMRKIFFKLLWPSQNIWSLNADTYFNKSKPLCK